MKSIKQRDEGFTGLEAAIVLIAFVVVAAVFSYVVLGAGFFTTQKSQETVYKGVEQATSNIQLIGNVYGTTTASTATTIDRLQFNIGLAPGAPSIPLTSMHIMVSNPEKTTVSDLTYGTTATGALFGASASTLSAQNQVTITIDLMNTTMGQLGATKKISVQLAPSTGAALPFERTAPATLSQNQILY